MLNRQNRALVQRRQQLLLLRSAELRHALARQSHRLKKPLALVDQLRTGIRGISRRPVWTMAAWTWLALVRPRHVLPGLLFTYAASRILRRTWQKLSGRTSLKA